MSLCCIKGICKLNLILDLKCTSYFENMSYMKINVRNICIKNNHDAFMRKNVNPTDLSL